MKTRNIISCLIILLMISLGACRKAVPPGPQGPQGEKGDPGVQGEKGPRGDKGDGGGIGNVIYSDWKYLGFEALSSGYWRTTMDVPALTNDVLTKGSTVVYFKRNGSVFKADYLTDDASLTQRLDLGKIWLYSSWDPSDTMFRYIIIPETAEASLAMKLRGLVEKSSVAQPSASFEGYNALCEALDIPL